MHHYLRKSLIEKRFDAIMSFIYCKSNLQMTIHISGPLIQVELCVELDDLEEFDPDLVEAVLNNTKRYVNMVSDIVYSLLPNYKHKDVSSNFFYKCIYRSLR